jgi:hypothetical protein
VAWFDPTGWHALDCTDPAIEALYIAWLQYQPSLKDILVTVHSDYINHILRDQFREQFRIDCVLFHPDERDNTRLYTVDSDIWMAVADFDADWHLQRGSSPRFFDSRLTVILEEEFKPDTPALTRSAVLKLTSTRQPDPILIADIASKYRASAGWTRVSS